MKKRLCSIIICLGSIISIMLCSCANQGIPAELPDSTGLDKMDGKNVLRGNASALYRASGKRYSIEWEIETESLSESAKAY